VGERVNFLGSNLLGFKLAHFRLDRTILQRSQSIVEGSLLLMSAYIASNALGVVRQIILNTLFGTGPEANAFYAAAQFPNTLFNLVAGGALTYAFIPVFISYEQENGPREAWRLASLVFNVLFVLLTALVLCGEWLTPAFVNHWLVPGYSSSEQALVTTLTRIMLVQPLILGLGTIATAILSSKRQFLLPALSIAVYNVGLIGGLLFSLALPGVGIYGPTYGVLAAAVCQVLVQVPGLLKEGLRYSWIWDLKNKGLHEVTRLFAPNALGLGITSAGAVVSTAYASYLPDRDSLAVLHNAQMLFALPVALFAQAVAQAAIPRMSQLAANGRYLHLRLLLWRVICVSVLLSIPCAVGLFMLGKPLIYFVFQHGAFTSHSTDLTVLALLGYVVGMPGSVASELCVRGFYALKDGLTPLFLDILVLAARFGFILLFIQIMAGPYVIMAIPIAISVVATMQALLLGGLLVLRLHMKIKTDKGLERLKRMRMNKLKGQLSHLLDEQERLETEMDVEKNVRISIEK
jgi:putative peptidoglycan lipid II flippase